MYDRFLSLKGKHLGLPPEKQFEIMCEQGRAIYGVDMEIVDGFMQITDRSKDVVKSGGEWISSIELENIAVAHPGIAEAAVIGVRHPKWDERPLVVAVKKQGAAVTREEQLGFYEGKVAKWMIPDDAVFVTDLPHTATGKLLKVGLRQRFKDYKLPTA
jgi:fatty-acyl-CoA synthase